MHLGGFNDVEADGCIQDRNRREHAQADQKLGLVVFNDAQQPAACDDALKKASADNGSGIFLRMGR